MERKIVWTELALSDIEETLEFYDYRNGSIEYSQSLIGLVFDLLSSISMNPCIGHTTEYPHVRYMVVVPDYSIFYHYDDDIITVLVWWDNRRNPSRLTYLFKQVEPTYFCEEILAYKSEE